MTRDAGIAYELSTPWAALCRRELPGIRLELLAGIEYADLARGEADLALRIRAPTQPELTTLLTLRARLGVDVRSCIDIRTYLKQHHHKCGS